MGEHSGSYPTGDPNKPAEVMDAEAVRAYELQLRGHDLDYISKALGLAPRTVQRRIATLILARERPIREVQRWIESDRYDRWTLIISERLDDEVSNADAARLLAEARQISAARRRLFALDDDAETPPPADKPDQQMDDWVAAARAESEDELARVRGEAS
jgi:hypothetical protein